MTDPRTGLPADNIPESLAAGDRSGYTSPTNIGGYLWSTIVARELGIISKADCSRRLLTTISTLERMEHHEPSGMFFNWYDEATGEALRTWPTSGDPVEPFVSSVDSGWLGAALLVVANADKKAGRRARALFDKMRWDAFYNPGDGKDGHPTVRTGGLMHGGFYPFADGRPGRHLRGHPHRRRGRLAHHPPLRHDRLGDPDHELPRHPHRAGPRQALLRRLAHLPGQL